MEVGLHAHRQQVELGEITHTLPPQKVSSNKQNIKDSLVKSNKNNDLAMKIMFHKKWFVIILIT